MANWSVVGWTYQIGAAHKRHLVVQSEKNQIQRLACGPFYDEVHLPFQVMTNSRRTYPNSSLRLFCAACKTSKWHQVLEVMERLDGIKRNITDGWFAYHAAKLKDIWGIVK